MARIHNFVRMPIPIRPVDQDYALREELILRDHLSVVRTRLANERTLLSYIRSTLYLFIGGLALLQVGDMWRIHWVGRTALVLSALFLLFGSYRYITLRRQLNRFYHAEVEQKTEAKARGTAEHGHLENESQ